MTHLNKDTFWETDCHGALAAIDLDHSVFLANYGEEAFSCFKQKLEESGFIFRGILADSAIFALPTPLLDDLRAEIDEILEEEVLAD